MEITVESGPSFFIRIDYLNFVDAKDIKPCAEFFEEKEEDILDAGLCFAAERKAEDYLSRSEQSRFGLNRKLLAKGFDKKAINRALDYLESKNYLSDARFARAWLNNRKISKAEGRIRLSAELASRGIDKNTVNAALDEYFEENSEEELCLRAYEKYLRLGKSEDKIIASLNRSGFSNKLIQTVKNK